MARIIVWCILIYTLQNCGTPDNRLIGSVERFEPGIDNLISQDAKIEIIAEGFDWSEGPIWIESQNMLLFSDVPRNTIYKWTLEKGTEIYLIPSGFTGPETQSNEPGSNGLLLDNFGNLVLCQHGDRRLARMNSSLNMPKPDFVTIASHYSGKRFNSPNDGVLFGDNFYFTDPPYGLLKQADDPAKEIQFQGVYKVSPDGVVSLLIDTLTRPNGIAFTPTGKMIVANSDPQKARWYQFELGDSTVMNGAVFYDATTSTASEKGLPDGLKIDKSGNIFASGPGGIWIFNSEAKLLGKIKLSEAASNCALSPDEKTLYITCDMYVLRVQLRD